MKNAGYFYEKIVNALSFSEQLYKLRRELNTKIDIPDTIAPAPRSSSSVVTRWFKRRRISIAEAYLMVIRDLESRHSRARLRALRMMVDVSFHAKTLDMPLNTARVQMALIKEAVKNRNNRRKQLELLQDFSVSSYGQYQVIRKLCAELNIIELPETGKNLRDMDAGFDHHVHDTATSGRKNATQLLIDAFIKGISELTIAYASVSAKEMMEEAIEAGRLVGIKVNIGLELSMLVQNRRFHFMILLPEMKRAKDLEKFFDGNRVTLKKIFEGLDKNQENRIEAVKRLLKNFNEIHLKELNEGFPDDPLYRIPALRMKNLEAFIPLASINRMQLGEFLFSEYKPVLFNRVLLLKVQHEKARRERKKGIISDWDFRIVENKDALLRASYRELNPDLLRIKYFTNPALADYQTFFDEPEKIKGPLTSAGCRLKVLHPLEHGLDKAKALLDKHHGLIDEVEIYNMQDSINRNPDEIMQFARYVNSLNRIAAREGILGLVPVCGSDSTGRSPKIPGMGFILEDRIYGRNRQKYLKRHAALPVSVSRMICAKGDPVDLDDSVPCPVIVNMGKVSEGTANLIGDEAVSAGGDIPLSRALRYLNPAFLNLLYALTGFWVANHYIGVAYALLWLGITGFRNTIADLVASRGTRMSEWKIANINFDNVARSLFWTGFSVPILGFVKTEFDLLWPYAVDGAAFNAAKFFFISFSNGLYLATHNILRGFNRKVVRANFFRSVLAWPLVTAFAPLGNLAGIPSIVQAKIWSDLVAGIIEGGNKYLTVLRVRRRDIGEIIPRILKEDQHDTCTAMLDLLYLFREEPRTLSSLKSVFNPNYLARGMLKDEAEGPKDAYALLRSVIDDEGLSGRILDFILSNHEHEVAADLANLVAVTLPEFREWLSAQSGSSGAGGSAGAGLPGPGHGPGPGSGPGSGPGAQESKQPVS